MVRWLKNINSVLERLNIPQTLRNEFAADLFSLRQILDTKIDRLALTIPQRNVPAFPIWDASEPSVRAVFDDLVKPGIVAFDIGAHIGGLTSSLSRLVGPRGIVVAFEASAETCAQLSTNLAINHRVNVTVVHGAVYYKPNVVVSLASDGAASRVVGEEATVVDERVETVALDDYCRANDLAPAFIKIDIEGAEFSALSGASEILTRDRPHIVFEHNMWDDRVMQMLQERGYWLMDAARYCEVSSSNDFGPHIVTCNIVAVHKDRLTETPYRVPPQVSLVAEFEPETGKLVDGVRRISNDLSPGRYIFEIIGGIEPTTQVLFSRVARGTDIIGQNWTDAPFFIHNHKHLPFQARFPGEYIFEVGEVGSSTSVCERFTIRLHRVDFSAR